MFCPESRAHWILPEARKYRIQAGVTVTKMLEKAQKKKMYISKATITRIEKNAGVSLVSASAYLNVLRQIEPTYPYKEAVSKATGLPFEPR